MKLLLIGYARSGKDTAAEYLRDNFNLTFKSSSLAACQVFLFDKLKDKYGYTTPEDCFNDRHNHRQEWFDEIKAYNKEDGAKLAKAILETSDCYVGMRNIDEFLVCKEQSLFDLIVWIDAEERVGVEHGSCNITKNEAHFVIENNGTEEEFKEKLFKLGKLLELVMFVDKIQ